jgi:microcystin-dependent protein
MSEPFIGEIRCFGFNFAPLGWSQCNGQILQIAENNALYSVIGSAYGGDGQTTFGLPDLQGRVPMHWGNGTELNTVVSQPQGVASVTLTAQEIPQHTHTLAAVVVASGAGPVERTAVPTSATFLSASQPPDQVWQKGPATPNTAFSPKAISQVGHSLPHENMQPYLVLNFCIALNGLFPPQQ